VAFVVVLACTIGGVALLDWLVGGVIDREDH